MKNIITFILICTLSTLVTAQQAKPVFKKLVYATYQSTQSGKDLKIAIKNYLEFDKNGSLHYLRNTNGGLLDTTYKISNDLMIELNKVFDGKKKLRTHLARSKSPEGAHFSGPLEFISLTNNHDTTDNFIVVDGFVSENLTHILNKISALPASNVYHVGKVFKNNTFESKIRMAHKACTYLPKIEEAPTLKGPKKATGN